MEKLIENKTGEDPKKFLQFEKITQPNEDLIKLASELKGETGIETLKNILEFLGKNIKYVDLNKENPNEWRKTWRKRTSQEILESKTSYGCSDTVSLLLSLVRICGIPAKFVDSKRIGKDGGHVWAEVFLNENWVNFDPASGPKAMDFKPEKSEHGPYAVISKSLGPTDALVGSLKDWEKLRKNGTLDKIEKEFINKQGNKN